MSDWTLSSCSRDLGLSTEQTLSFRSVTVLCTTLFLLLSALFIMPGGAVRLAGLPIGGGRHTVSTLPQRSTLLAASPREQCVASPGQPWAVSPPSDCLARVAPVSGYASVYRLLGLNRRGALPLCYTTIHSTLCYSVTLPHWHIVLHLSHCHMHTVSCYNTHTVLHTKHTCTYGK